MEEHKGYYVIRHIASQELMPQMKRDRGYSHWNPGVNPLPLKALNTPRLIFGLQKSRRCINQWVIYANARTRFEMFGDEENFSLVTESDGRDKTNLEIVEVTLVLGEVIK